jgi:hypothetical protein
MEFVSRSQSSPDAGPVEDRVRDRVSVRGLQYDLYRHAQQTRASIARSATCITSTTELIARSNHAVARSLDLLR